MSSLFQKHPLKLRQFQRGAGGAPFPGGQASKPMMMGEGPTPMNSVAQWVQQQNATMKSSGPGPGPVPSPCFSPSSFSSQQGMGPGPGNGPIGGPNNGPMGPGNGPMGPGNGPMGPGNGPMGPGNGPMGPGNGPMGPGNGPMGPTGADGKMFNIFTYYDTLNELLNDTSVEDTENNITHINVKNHSICKLCIIIILQLQ